MTGSPFLDDGELSLPALTASEPPPRRPLYLSRSPENPNPPPLLSPPPTVTSPPFLTSYSSHLRTESVPLFLRSTVRAPDPLPKPAAVSPDDCDSSMAHMCRLSPLPISTISGTGTGELLDLFFAELKESEALENIENEEEQDYVPCIAIVGRPNDEKSSILNALVGEARTTVSPISGTTRDANYTEFIGPDGWAGLSIQY